MIGEPPARLRAGREAEDTVLRFFHARTDASSRVLESLHMWMLYATGSALTAALVGIFGKIGLQQVDPTQATVVRGVIMAVILVLGGLLFGKFAGFQLSDFSGKAWVFIVLSALAGASSWLLYFIALKTGPASAVAVIDKMSVVVVILLAALFLGESLTLKSVIGIILTIAGTLFILFK